jgi:RNA polymerase sigma factor (sigma-70 family)
VTTVQGHPTTTPAPDPGNRRIPAGGACALVARKVRTRFRDGDPDAVRIVFRAYGRLVYTVAFRVLGNRGLAEEATQQVFVKAWRAAGNLDENRDMGPWLATIARRVAIDVYRREAHRSADPIESVPPGDPALVSRPESAGAVSDIWEVRRAVTELPQDEQKIVRMQLFEGIAERLRLPVGTVKSRSFRAHKRLAAQLAHLRA